MKALLIIITTCLLCVACGVKSDPEYKSQSNYNKTIIKPHTECLLHVRLSDISLILIG